MKRSFDYVTVSLAAIAIGCLIVLAGCDPQIGEVLLIEAPVTPV